MIECCFVFFFVLVLARECWEISEAASCMPTPLSVLTMQVAAVQVYTCMLQLLRAYINLTQHTCYDEPEQGARRQVDNVAVLQLASLRR